MNQREAQEHFEQVVACLGFLSGALDREDMREALSEAIQHGLHVGFIRVVAQRLNEVLAKVTENRSG